MSTRPRVVRSSSSACSRSCASRESWWVSAILTMLSRPDPARKPAGPSATVSRAMGHRIGVIAGDGIGRDVIAEGLRVLDAVGLELDLTDFDLGSARYLRDGTVLDDASLDELRELDAIYLG